MKLTLQDVEKAYQKLSDEDRKNIDRMSQRLEVRVHMPRFGKWQALELLAKLGMWMNKEGV